MGTIVDIGRGLQRYGLKVGEHSAFGGVKPGAHSPTGYHPHDEAIDVTDWRKDNGPEYEGGQNLSWQERTRRLKDRARQLGGFNEVLGPGDKAHDNHLHLALRGSMKDWNDQKLEWLATGRYRKADGGYGNDLPGGAAGTGTLASTSDAVVTTETVERQQVDDWKASASAADRSTDPSSAGYWQRQDMKVWAQANPKLAAAAMAKAGVDPATLQAPSTHTVTETRDVPAAPQAPAAPRPEDRGALNGTRVGGAKPPSLQPYVFEIHADATADQGGKTGFIGSYLDRDNPLFQSINAAYGNYGANHSRQWRGGDLGAPRHGVSIIETRTAGPGMGDTKAQETEANRLYGTLMADPDVKAGKRPLVFFAGHADTTNAGQQGAAGGDAPEKVWNTGVMAALRKRVTQEGRTNFQFMDSIVDNDDKGSNTNWARAKSMRQQWLEQQQGGVK